MFSLLSTTVQNSTLVMLRTLVYQLPLNILSSRTRLSSTIQTTVCIKIPSSAAETDGADMILKTGKNLQNTVNEGTVICSSFFSLFFLKEFSDHCAVAIFFITALRNIGIVKITIKMHTSKKTQTK